VNKYFDSIRDKDKWIWDVVDSVSPQQKPDLRFKGGTPERQAERRTHHRKRLWGGLNKMGFPKPGDKNKKW